nr:winged helix-turn-helix transcriptional regulator [Paeniclostridium sordellii]
MIIWELKNNKMRFGELQRAIEGYTKKMLTQQLDLLIKHNIVMNEKKAYKDTVESTYCLSKGGLKLLTIIWKL